jgi:pimeloyl-ACP methyl ester carboxylesterase
MMLWRNSRELAPIAAPGSSGAMTNTVPTTAWVWRATSMQRSPPPARAGPFVLAGHSLGGPYITIYTGLFGNEVAGLVYVDSSHPDQNNRTEAALGKLPKRPAMEAVYKVAARFAWAGVVRLGAILLGGELPPNVPIETAKTSKVFVSTSLKPTFSGKDAISKTFEQARAFRQLGERPIAVLTRGKQEALPKGTEMSEAEREKSDKIWLELQNDMAAWSSRSTHRILDDAGHYIQFDRPDAVVAAIREVVNDVRAGAPTQERTVTPR